MILDIKECYWRRSRPHGRRQLPGQLRADGSATAFVDVQRRYPCRAARSEALRYEARLYPVWRFAPSLTYVSLHPLTFSMILGLRPFGVSLLYAGYDPHYHFQLYHSDPSGNYSGWKATCIGANNGTAQSLLKQEYKDDIEVKDAIGLVLRTMSKTMDSTTLGSEKCQ